MQVAPDANFPHLLQLTVPRLTEQFLTQGRNSVEHPLKKYFDDSIKLKRIGVNDEGKLQLLPIPENASEAYTLHSNEISDSVLKKLYPVFQDLFLGQQQSIPVTRGRHESKGCCSIQ